MKHEKEIIRWAKCPQGTLVWFKEKDKWFYNEIPQWDPDIIYIVADRYAELRKALVDGKILQFKKTHIGTYEIDPTWCDWNSHGECFSDNTEYRIKPEPVYMWQWIYKNDDGSFDMTGLHFTKNPRDEYAERYEPSKQEM